MEVILKQHKCAEFRFIILDIDTIWLIFDNSMGPTNGDIVDSDFRVMAAAHIIGEFVWSEAQNVDGSRRIFLKR